MSSGRVATRYAKGLLKYGNQKGNSSEIFASVQYMISVLDEVKMFREFLANPAFSVDEKCTKIKELVRDPKHSDIVAFIQLLLKNHREEYLYNSLLIFRNLYLREKNILDVVIESVNELEQEAISRIESYIKSRFGKKCEIKVEVNPTLIAGIVILVDGKVIDYSVKGQLEGFKKKLVG